MQVRSKEDVLTCARHIHTDSLAPVFLTSSVTGDGLELVKLFFNLLPQRHKWADRVRESILPVLACIEELNVPSSMHVHALKG